VRTRARAFKGADLPAIRGERDDDVFPQRTLIPTDFRESTQLRSRLRCYRKIHVIYDNAACHTSQAVAIYLWEYRQRIDVHFLPRYSPECNPIERVRWDLHDQITCNHPGPRTFDRPFANRSYWGASRPLGPRFANEPAAVMPPERSPAHCPCVRVSIGPWGPLCRVPRSVFLFGKDE